MPPLTVVLYFDRNNLPIQTLRLVSANPLDILANAPQNATHYTKNWFDFNEGISKWEEVRLDE